MTAIDSSLDTCGLTCPIPILKAKKALTQLAPGAVLEVLATDPAAPKDFVAFCKATGHELLSSSQAGGTWHFLIKRS